MPEQREQQSEADQDEGPRDDRRGQRGRPVRNPDRGRVDGAAGGDADEQHDQA
jgi:hypothetical protein